MTSACPDRSKDELSNFINLLNSHDESNKVYGSLQSDRQNVLWIRALQDFHEATPITFKCSTKSNITQADFLDK